MSKKYKQLSELGEIITGKTPSTANAELWGGCIPFITPTDINGYTTFYQTKTERTVSDYGANKQKKTVLPPNSVCITCIGSTIGKPCVTKIRSITNQQINSIISNSKNDYRYVYYLLRLNLPYLQLIGGGSGAGTPIISKNKFSKFKFLVEDDLPTQRRIASILSAYDNLIENNNKRIRLLEQMAENLYKEWFVRFRFPGHEKVEMENGLPKGWKIKRYKEILTIKYGKGLETTKLTSTGYPVFGSNGVIGFYTKYMYETPQVLISCRGASSGVVNISLPFSFITSNSLVCERTRPNELTFEYLKYYFLNTNLVQYQTGSAQPQITINNIEKLKFIIPNIELQDEFARITRRIDKEILIIQQQTSLLTRQRDLLLPRLMSGKLEVKE